MSNPHLHRAHWRRWANRPNARALRELASADRAVDEARESIAEVTGALRELSTRLAADMGYEDGRAPLPDDEPL